MFSDIHQNITPELTFYTHTHTYAAELESNLYVFTLIIAQILFALLSFLIFHWFLNCPHILLRLNYSRSSFAQGEINIKIVTKLSNTNYPRNRRQLNRIKCKWQSYAVLNIKWKIYYCFRTFCHETVCCIFIKCRLGKLLYAIHIFHSLSAISSKCANVVPSVGLNQHICPLCSGINISYNDNYDRYYSYSKATHSNAFEAISENTQKWYIGKATFQCGILHTIYVCNFMQMNMFESRWW